MSSEGSQNYARFQADVQRMVNESLRLNKGVQTEGDAQRAAEEILRNLNDPGVVRTQLTRLRDLNQSAALFHQRQISDIQRYYPGLGAAPPSPQPTRRLRYDPSTGQFAPVTEGGPGISEERARSNASDRKY
jgi:hypothetical protein